MNTAKKLLIISFTVVLLSAGFAILFYLQILPRVVAIPWIISKVESVMKNQFDVDCSIVNPRLKTHFDTSLEFYVDSLEIKQNVKELLKVDKFDARLSYSDLLNRKLTIKKLYANSIYADISGLMKVFASETEVEQNEPPIFVDFYSVYLGVGKCNLRYDSPEFNVKFDANNVIMDRTKDRKFLHFDFDLDLLKGSDRICLTANDKDRIYMENGAIYVKNFPLDVDSSEVLINVYADKHKKYKLNFESKKFSAKDIADIITSNILIPNGKELLAPICDVNGSVDFNLELSNNNTKGEIVLNESNFKVVDLLKMPVKMTQGRVEIGKNDIKLKDFKGYYNNKLENHFKFDGDIKDYMKTLDTKIISDIFVTNDFFKNYVSKLLGFPIELVGDAGSRMTLLSKNGSLDILWYFLLKENEGFKLGDEYLVLKEYQTLFKLDMGVEKNILKIRTVDYCITNMIKKGMTPILSFNGNIDMFDNMRLLDINMNIPRALPSEFLNFLAGQKIFEKGTFSGKMSIIDKKDYPVMDGELQLNGVRIPSQRIYIKNGQLNASGNEINIISNGRFKRSKYDLKGKILNELRLPIIVKDVNLTVDSIDVEKFLMAPSGNTESNTQPLTSKDGASEENDDAYTFSKGLIIVEKCKFNLLSGIYKELKFGNLQADLTLDKDGVLNIQSNKFDIADGISTLKVKADLIKQLYYLRLGVKDVDSNIMATTILGLPREISGKAKGLIEINSDKDLKLNGDMKFSINNGTIEKVGYVQYILKVASLFRNPFAMITPTTLSDLVNIPDGSFDNIYGELSLKDNVVEKMMIKSSAKELASFIIGRYDLETNDAILRIYTKFSNRGLGFAGCLRSLSFNALAHKITTSARNESNYYSAEIAQIPKLEIGEEAAEVFLTKVDGDVINFNFLSSLKKIK